MTGFRKRSTSIFNHDSNEKKKERKKKKTATNNSNFPFLSFSFSFSAWFQVFWGGGCWSNVIFNAFTFKKSSRVCIYSHCTLPTLEALRVFKIGTITELCSLSGVQERSMISLHNLQHSGFATIDYNNLFQLKVLCVFLQPRRQCGPLFSDSG